MFWEIINQSEDSFVLKTKTFSEGDKKVFFVSSDEADTIFVCRKESPLGYFNPDFKTEALEMGVWDALLGHESLHCCSEFIAPWYAPIDILPETLSDNLKTLIPNSIEDLVINHTLWLWEENPIRSGGYAIPDVTEKLIKCFEKFPYQSSSPSSVAAVVECFGKFHVTILKSILKQREGSKTEDDSISLKNTIRGNVIQPLAKEVNGLFNSLAVSLSKEKRTVNVILNIAERGRPNRPSFEARYDRKPVPQYVPLHLDGVRRIYDLLDVHFAEAYNMRVSALRKEAYENYKKVILSQKKQSARGQDDEKSVVLFPNIYREDKKLICDFSLQIINKKSDLLSGTRIINHEKGNMEITGGVLLEPWERFERMRMFELRRLKQWVET
jgi:hypothetical protein